MNKAFLDIETTGLNSCMHEIIEVAIIFDDREHYHRFIRPKRIDLADPVALRINRFDDRSGEWSDSITHEQLAFDLACLLNNRIIIGHNPSFDMSFIQELLEQHGERIQSRNVMIDTVTLAHEHLSPLGLKRLSLDSIRSYLGWCQIGAHTALKDAQDVQRLYNTLLRATFFDRLNWRLKSKQRAVTARKEAAKR